MLKHAVGWTFEEIAEADGIPVGTAKCQAHRGRARLRERLSA
jgi:DNA-directed RNA polymerase specialized sigma24 family protein